MQIKAYKKFQKFYTKLSSKIQKKIDKQIRLLAKDFHHPSLHCKKIQGSADIWEARVAGQYRMAFEIISGTIFLRVVADHDQALKVVL